MKKIIIGLLFFNFSLTAIAQIQPRIKVPGSQTEAEKAKAEKDKLFATPGVFKPGTSFKKNEKYFSADNRYFFVFQDDGNFVIYKVAGSKAVWFTHTNGKAVKTCMFQRDGNLVLYDYTGKPVWDAWTDQKNRNGSSWFKGDTFNVGGVPLHLYMQSDGNLVIYGSTSKSGINNVLWSSNSFERN
jgi:hypothetical protein